ncbi:MAG: ice-binding family protein [Patescibacteria group bacterium]
MLLKKLQMRLSTGTSIALLAVTLTLGLAGWVWAATTPDLGEAASFAILSGTYTNTVAGTTINGDLGYTTGPAVAPTVNGTVYSPPSTKYSQAGLDQASALAALNAQACTHTFPDGAVDLATDTSHGPIGVYEPGVYCTTATSAAEVGTAGITLSGSGTYIFRIDGALTTVADSSVTLTGGASYCDVFWTPTAATTLGANSTFAGIDIDASGITIGSTVTWTGSALAFGGTVSTDTDTISVPACATDLANGGVGPSGKSNSWNTSMLAGIFGLALLSLGVVLRKRTS